MDEATLISCGICGGKLSKNASGCPHCGEPNPATAIEYDYSKGGGADDVVATVIPYRNKCALVGYYLGLFSIAPVIGIPLAITAIVLGAKGLSYRTRHPEAHGKAHAVVAIVGGIIGLLVNVGGFLIFSAMFGF